MGNKNEMVAAAAGTWGVRGSLQSLVAALVGVVLFAAFYLRQQQVIREAGGDKRSSVQFQDYVVASGNRSNDGAHHLISSDSSESLSSSSCDWFSGKWVLDKESYPLYKEKECSYMSMSEQVACKKFGRKDLSYQNWRWQPHQCNLPRFNGTALLEKLRNKRLVYVGDSLNRNQWGSMVCLIESSLPNKLTSMHINGSLLIFKATEYNATVEFYWAPLIVESNSDNPSNHRVIDRIVRITSIEKHARFWTDADVLVFDSYYWWRMPYTIALWGSFGSSDGIYKKVEMLRIYEMALKTWSDWLEIHIDRTKTQLFFMTMSATHEWAKEWGAKTSLNCLGETEPITKEGYMGSGSDPKMMAIVERVIEELKERGLEVKMLNITQMTEYRKDAHPAIYGKRWPARTGDPKSKPVNYTDCLHWCLPGVPDVWNELLYASLLHPQN